MPPTKPIMDMTEAEFRAELARINREGFIRRTRALEEAATEAAYERVRRQNPKWTPKPLEENGE